MNNVKDSIVSEEWIILGDFGEAKGRGWTKKGYMNSHLRQQKTYKYNIDNEIRAESTRKECHKIYSDNCFVIEYRVEKTPVRIIPAREYIDELFDGEINKLKESKLAKMKLTAEREERRKSDALAARRKTYAILKKEIEG